MLCNLSVGCMHPRRLRELCRETGGETVEVLVAVLVAVVVVVVGRMRTSSY